MDQEDRDKKIEELAKKASLASSMAPSRSEEKVEETDMEHLTDVLHKKSAIPSLRTYQGDMAEFIKEKNESVMSIAAKEHKKKEDEERRNNIAGQKSAVSNFTFNFTYFFFGLILLIGGVGAFFLLPLLDKKTPVEVVIQNSIIPANQKLDLQDIDRTTAYSKLMIGSKASGITNINIIKNGKRAENFSDFLNVFDITIPQILKRNIKGEYMFGYSSWDEKNSHFVVMRISDFGSSFSGMLEWEESLPKDFYFLIAPGSQDAVIPKGEWRDIIVSNKDTRGYFVNEKAIIGYTFIDKNTILIVNNIDTIGYLQATYISKSVAR